MTRFSFGRKVRWAAAAALILSAALFFGCKLPWLTNPPAVPSGVTASDGTFTDKVRIVWQSVDRAQSYQVYRAPSETGQYEKIGETSSTAYDDSGVTPNVVYWYKVRACNAAGCSDQSAPDSGYAQSAIAGAPPAPVNVSATDGTFTDRIRVTWDAVPGATRYEIYRDVSAGGIFPLRGISTTPSFDDTDVIPGRTYWYRVRACNVAGCSVLSAADSGYAEPVIPDTPSGVSASDGTYEDRVRVNWNPVPGAANYEIWRATSQGGTYSKIGETDSPPYDDTTVTVGTTYWYRVKACSAAGCSPLSASDSGYAQTGGGGGGGGGEEPTPPARPTGVTATDGSDDYLDSIYITWNEVADADTYQIYRSETEGGAYTQIAETTTTEYEDTNDAFSPVTKCRTYWYKVKACNEVGCSDLSDADSGYCGTRLSGVPENVTASDGIYPDKIHITWDPVEGASTYQIWRSTAYTGDYGVAPIATVTETEYDDTDTTPGVQYWYKIKACSDSQYCDGCGGCRAGCTGFSIPDSGYRSCIPPAPTDVTASDTDPIQITWTAVDMPAGFEVTKYEVYRSDSETGAYVKIGEVTGTPPSTSYNDDTADPGITYWYKVKACNACGCGPLSNADSGTRPNP